MTRRRVDGVEPELCPVCQSPACATQTFAPVRVPVVKRDNGAHVLVCDEMCVVSELKRHVLQSNTPPELYLLCAKGHGWMAKVETWDV